MYAIMYIGGDNMTTTNITNFRKNAFNYVEQTIKYNEPLNISTKDGDAVLLSAEDYSGLMEYRSEPSPYLPDVPLSVLEHPSLLFWCRRFYTFTTPLRLHPDIRPEAVSGRP